MVKERKTQSKKSSPEVVSSFNLYLFPPQRFKEEGQVLQPAKKKSAHSDAEAFLVLEAKP